MHYKSNSLFYTQLTLIFLVLGAASLYPEAKNKTSYLSTLLTSLLHVQGNASVGGELTVTGQTYLTGNTVVSGDLTVGGTIINPGYGNYLYAYSTESQSLDNPNEYKAITLNVDGPFDGWIQPSPSLFRCNQTGTYSIGYEASVNYINPSSSFATFRILRMGTEIPGSARSLALNSSYAEGELSKNLIVGLVAGDTLTFEWKGTSDSLQLDVIITGPTTSPSFSVSIIRIQ